MIERAEKGLPVKLRPIDEMDEDELADRLPDPAGRMTLKIKLTLLLRLQQAAAGFLTDDLGHTAMIDGTWDKLPRMVATMKAVHGALENKGKVIVWSHFRPALEALYKASLDEVCPAVLIHGGVTGAARSEAIRLFKDPESSTRLMIAHPRTMGVGQNLAVARSCFYYTNSYSLIQRTQSEDRVHRIGQEGTVTIGDLVAHDAPCDAEVLASLRQKDDFAQRFMKLKMEKLKC